MDEKQYKSRVEIGQNVIILNLKFNSLNTFLYLTSFPNSLVRWRQKKECRVFTAPYWAVVFASVFLVYQREVAQPKGPKYG